MLLKKLMPFPEVKSIPIPEIDKMEKKCIGNLDRKEQWAVLHSWASSFRAKNGLTAKQFLQIFNLKCDNWYVLYLYPKKRNLDPSKDGVEDELLQGLLKAFKLSQPLANPDLAADRFEMQREKLQALGVLDCYFEEDDDGLVAECYMDGPVLEFGHVAQLIQQAIELSCKVKVIGTELSVEKTLSQLSLDATNWAQVAFSRSDMV